MIILPGRLIHKGSLALARAQGCPCVPEAKATGGLRGILGGK